MLRSMSDRSRTAWIRLNRTMGDRNALLALLAASTAPDAITQQCMASVRKPDPCAKPEFMIEIEMELNKVQH